MPNDAETEFIGLFEQFLFIEEQRAAGVTSEDGRIGFAHYFDGLEAGNGHIPQHMLPAAGRFDQPHFTAIDERGGATEHGVRSLHGFYRDAGPITNDDTLP